MKEFEKFNLSKDELEIIKNINDKTPHLNTFMVWRSISGDLNTHVVEGTLNSFFQALSCLNEVKDITKKELIKNILLILEKKDNTELTLIGNKKSKIDYIRFEFTNMSQDEFLAAEMKMYF